MQNLAELGKVIPGIKVTRGGFELIQISLRSGEFTDLVPQVPMALPEGPRAQRGYMASHMRKIATYIAWNSKKWAFGPISLAIHPDLVTWKPLDDSQSSTAAFGTVTIHEGSRNSIMILDGQHRTAALDALLSGQTKGMRGMNKKVLADAQRSIRNSSLSIDLYLIGNKKDAGQLFSDMANARAITLSERATLDLRDPFNEAVAAFINPTPKVPPADIQWLTHLVVPPVLPSGMPGPRSLHGKSVPYWLMPHDLAKVLKWRLLPAGRATANHKKAHTKTSILAAASTLFNVELPTLRPEWAEIKTSINAQTLSGRRSESWVWMPAAVMQAAASLRAYTSVGSNIDPLVEWWQSQDFGREVITSEHPLFRMNNLGKIVALSPNSGRELAEYLLGQAA